MTRSQALPAYCLFICLTMLLFAPNGVAQVSNQLNTGYPENGIFHGSEIDNVQINNGGLHVEIPISGAKGRGLSTASKVVYNSKSWTFHTRCFTSGGGFCEDDVQADTLGYSTLVFSGAFDYMFNASSRVCQQTQTVFITIIGGYTLREPDGTKHHFAPDPLVQSACVPPHYTSTVYADDGSGWIMQINTADGSMISAISKTGVKIQAACDLCATNIPASLIVDANGNQLAPSSICCVVSGLGGTDTLGRTIPANGGYYDSSGTLQTPILSGSTSVAIDTTSLCQFSNADTCVPDKGTWTLPTQLQLPNGDVFTFTYAQNGGGELAGMTLPTGGQISWTWGTWFQGGRNVATRTVAANGVTGTWTYSLGPTGGIVTDPAHKDTQYDCITSTFPNVGCDVIFRTIYFDGTAGASPILKTILTDYLSVQLSPPPASPYYLPTRETTTWNQQNLVSKTETDWDSMVISGVGTVSWRNPTEKRLFDWGSGAPGTLLQRTHSSYRHLEADGTSYLAFNVADLPTLVQTYDGAGNLLAQTQNSYDGSNLTSTGTCQAPGAPNHDYCNFSTANLVRGNVTQTSRWLNTNTSWLNTTNTYDDLGNVLTTSDPLGHQTTFDYTDSWSGTGCVTAANTRAFPTTITNAKGQRTKTTFFPCNSLVQSSKDENDIVAGRNGATSTYDLMNRLLVSQKLDSGGQILAKTSLSYNDSVLPLSITKTVTAAPSPDMVSTVILDGLGRTSQTVQNDPEGNVTSEVTYDALGRQSTVTNPHRGVVAATDGTTQFVYDTLGRTTDVIKPDNNTVHKDYAGNAMTVTDETLHQRRSVSDGLGRLIEVDEPSGQPPVANNAAFLQTDQNFVLKNSSGVPLWATNTAGSNAINIEMQDDGNLVMYSLRWIAGTYSWPPPPGPYPPADCSIGHVLNAPQILPSNKCITSPAGQYMLWVAPDGTLMIYDLARNVVTLMPLGGGHPGAYGVMQVDGNFVMYTADGSTALWSSGTNGTFAQRLELDDTGRILINRAVWNSGTMQPPNTQTLAHPGCDMGFGLGLGGGVGTGQCFVSFNGLYELLLQTDGNLVLYDRSVTPNAAIWSTNTALSPLDPSVALRTLYTYDALSNLTCVEQHGDAATGTGCSAAPSSDATSPWRVRRFTYDSLSRLLTAKNPEAGQTSYQYDSDSNVISKIDARGVIINYSPAASPIDVLHRVTQKTYSDGTPTVTYQYDTGCCGVTPANPAGRLTAAFSGNTELVFSYDPMGRIKTQWDCPPSGIARGFCYVISATYDDVGNITSLTYPDNRVVTSAYNAAGRFLRTDLASFGGTAFNFNYYAVPQSTAAASWGYWPTGTMNRGTYGNGVIETTGYNNRLQVSSIADSLSGTAFFSKTYGYADASGHNNGNILSIADALSATRNQTFTYDSLNRILTGSQADNIFNLTYSYDAWGNMKESGTSSFQPLFDVSNRMIPSGGCSPNLVPYCYDAAGELLMDNHNHVYAYDGEARIKTVDGNGAAYTYNPLGNRVRKDAGATSTEYFFFAGGAIAELDPTSGTWTDYIGYGKRIAKDTSNNGTGAQYYHGDHLSSARIMTDSAGVKISDCTFNPFGEQVICSPDNASNHYRFTGKERDQETGLDNFGKRYYGSALGRFITPDPLLNSGQPWNPQSWNRYAYVENNPLRYTDPTGLYKFGDCSGTSAQCLADEQRFRDSIAKAKEALNGLDPKSDQAKALKATLDKLGDEDDGNIKINFGDAGKTNGEPNLGRTIGNSITINYDEADKAARSFNLNASEKAALDAGVTTHEGTHAGGGPSILGFVGMRGEHAAYFTESATYQGLHNNDKPFQLWNNSWLTVDQDKFPVEKTREQAIQHVLHPDKVPAPVVPDAGGPK